MGSKLDERWSTGVVCTTEWMEGLCSEHNESLRDVRNNNNMKI